MKAPILDFKGLGFGGASGLSGNFSGSWAFSAVGVGSSGSGVQDFEISLFPLCRLVLSSAEVVSASYIYIYIMVIF